MLVLLLGAGTGLENNIRWQFRDDAINSIWIYPGMTSQPWEGQPVGRVVQFSNADIERIVEVVPEIDHISGRFYLRGEFTITAQTPAGGTRSGAFSVRSCHPGHRYIEQTMMVAGRYLSPRDLAAERKVIVIGLRVAEFLFPGRPLSGVLGEWVDLAGIQYRVVGVFEDVGGEGEMRQVYIPITTAQAAYGGGDQVHQVMFTVGDATVEEAAGIADRVRRVLARNHHFAPGDLRAVRVRNNLESFHEIQQIFVWLRIFIWLVGVGTVAAGVVGVSNIMLISVRERTAELGLRKAIGATPGQLVSMVVQEALLLTATAGYAGLVGGVAVLEAVRRLMPENEYIRDPQVDMPAVIGATVLLVVAGTLAGWFPARRAARVAPVEALRSE
ncbi:MAG: ABC transporter permease [Alphaproteobacteria bacterium]|nr:ABC transporter permease [Alphaproteobacteria bacterium]